MVREMFHPKDLRFMKPLFKSVLIRKMWINPVPLWFVENVKVETLSCSTLVVLKSQHKSEVSYRQRQRSGGYEKCFQVNGEINSKHKCMSILSESNKSVVSPWEVLWTIRLLPQTNRLRKGWWQIQHFVFYFKLVKASTFMFLDWW